MQRRATVQYSHVEKLELCNANQTSFQSSGLFSFFFLSPLPLYFISCSCSLASLWFLFDPFVFDISQPRSALSLARETRLYINFAAALLLFTFPLLLATLDIGSRFRYICTPFLDQIKLSSLSTRRSLILDIDRPQ